MSDLYTKQRIRDSWNYLMTQYQLSDSEAERERINDTAKAVYDKAVKYYGFNFADTLEKPKLKGKYSKYNLDSDIER